jgi:hypothetical protein
VREGEVLPVLYWALLLGALAGGLWIWTEDALSVALLGGAAVGAFAVAGGLAVRRRRRDRPDMDAVPDISLSTALIAAALAAMLIGAEAGLWLVWIGAGTLAFGIGGLMRELLAARRALKAAVTSGRVARADGSRRAPPARSGE